MTRYSPSRYYDATKRTFDVIGAITGLALTAPVQAVVALLVWKKLGSPVIFRQARPGRDGQIFHMLKFRSMLPEDASAGRVSDEDRLTKFGLVLRATSLDELPTLINVVKGDMSLVGPRPLLVKYLDRYTPEQSQRHGVRPGITGLAQVRGRNSLSWDEKFALDLEYVEHRSLLLDLQILLDTVRAVALRRGITAADNVTMPEFQGSGRFSVSEDK